MQKNEQKNQNYDLFSELNQNHVNTEGKWFLEIRRILSGGKIELIIDIKFSWVRKKIFLYFLLKKRKKYYLSLRNHHQLVRLFYDLRFLLPLRPQEKVILI